MTNLKAKKELARIPDHLSLTISSPGSEQRVVKGARAAIGIAFHRGGVRRARLSGPEGYRECTEHRRAVRGSQALGGEGPFSADGRGLMNFLRASRPNRITDLSSPASSHTRRLRPARTFRSCNSRSPPPPPLPPSPRASITAHAAPVRRRLRRRLPERPLRV